MENEHDRRFTPEDRERLSRYLEPEPVLPLAFKEGKETAAEADTFLRSQKPAGNLRKEAFSSLLPPEYDGVITRKLLFEGIFEQFFAESTETDIIQRGKAFLSFLGKWRKRTEKRFSKSKNYATDIAIDLVQRMTPRNVQNYASYNKKKYSRQVENTSPDNPYRLHAQERLTRWSMYEDTSRIAFHLKNAEDRNRRKTKM